MISFDTQHHRFQMRAVAILLRDDAVLLHRAEGSSFWALPGGRVELGETASETIVRELREELDVNVTAGPLIFVVENFFTYEGRPFHEIGLYFLATAEPGSRLLTEEGPYESLEGEQKLTFAWFPRSRLSELEVRPVFLAQALAEPELTFSHRVQRETARDPRPRQPDRGSAAL